MSALEVCRACELAPRPPEQRWLITDFWAEQAVGIVGGEPKCCKSFCALDMAVAVASGAPCLRRFAVPRRGPVLLFAAEDSLDVVRRRLEGICAAARVDFDTLDVHVIKNPTVRLDLERDRLRLRASVESIRPRLLILDPFVRLHRVDENTAAEVAPLLAYLRELQRRFATAVALVHHARKGGHARAGQALRGSSEFHAWGDSNLHLRRQREQLLLSIEHRAAASRSGLALELRAEDEALALRVVDTPSTAETAPPSTIERVAQVLTSAPAPMSRGELRSACRIRNASLGEALSTLVAEGRALVDHGRYRAAP